MYTWYQYILDSAFALVEIRDFFMNKFKTFFAVLSIFSLLVFNFQFAIAATEVNTAGVDYLKMQTPSPWTTMALVSANETGLSGDHLKANPGSNAINYTAPIMAIVALGENPRTYPDSDFVAELKGFFDGTQIGDASTLNDDVFGILALISSGELLSSTEIMATKSYLISQQNADGGWGFVAGGSSDTNTTAGAIMALIAAGDSASSSTIQNALTYLKSSQNEDGGFPYDPVSPYGTASDASSDAWVISALNAVGINPESWNQGDNTPVTHLKSLQADGGYFQYQDGSGEDAFSPVTTSYAVIALNGDFYPIDIYKGSTPKEPVVSYRIEGSSSTVCSGSTVAVTALDVVKNVADECGYTYNIDELSFGPYLTQIADDAAEGMIGWMYRVNWESPSVGAGDYNLTTGDDVLWYFGDFSWEPLRLSSNATNINSGDSVTFTTEAYGAEGWVAVDNVAITGANNVEWTTNTQGTVTISPDDGIYNISADKEGYIRSNRLLVTVGDLSGQTVGVHANVIGDGSVGGANDTVSFIVTPDTLDFGNLKRGESASDILTIENTGTADIRVEAIVSGGDLFEQELELDNKHWVDFSASVETASQEDVNVSVKVPNNFPVNGDQTGDIIFWAIAQ